VSLPVDSGVDDRWVFTGGAVARLPDDDPGLEVAAEVVLELDEPGLEVVEGLGDRGLDVVEGLGERWVSLGEFAEDCDESRLLDTVGGVEKLAKTRLCTSRTARGSDLPASILFITSSHLLGFRTLGSRD